MSLKLGCVSKIATRSSSYNYSVARKGAGVTKRCIQVHLTTSSL